MSFDQFVLVFASVLLLECLTCAFQVFIFVLDQVFVAWEHCYDAQITDKVISTVACHNALPFSLLMGMNEKEVAVFFTARS